MVFVEDASAIMTQGAALVMGIVSLTGVILKFALSRSHNPRLVALETKAEHYDEKLGQYDQQFIAAKDQIMKGVTVADTIVPQLNQIDQAHTKQISELQQTIASLQSQIALIQTVVPAVPTPQPLQPAVPKPEPAPPI